MEENANDVDRIVRVIIAFTTVVGAVGFCPLYRILGIPTRRYLPGIPRPRLGPVRAIHHPRPVETRSRD